MSTYRKLLILCIILALFAVQAQAADGSAASAAQTKANVTMSDFTKGTVVETMDAPGYTYLQLENNGQKRWAAIPTTQLKVGDEVEIASGMIMRNFTSKTLGRTFDSIIFSRGLVNR